MAGRKQPIVKGLDGLKERLDRLGKKSADKVVRAGIMAGMRVVNKSIKQQVPSRHKSVRRAIAYRFRRSRKMGIVEAKVGAGVGKQRPSGLRGDKLGIGITKWNVHWWILGTKDRRPKKTGILRGFAGGVAHWFGQRVKGMPGHPVVKEGLAASERAAFHKVMQTMADGIRREAEKLRQQVK